MVQNKDVLVPSHCGDGVTLRYYQNLSESNCRSQQSIEAHHDCAVFGRSARRAIVPSARIVSDSGTKPLHPEWPCQQNMRRKDSGTWALWQ